MFEHYCSIWSSGKILELTIKSMINRQRFSDKNRMLTPTTKNCIQIEAAIKEVIEPFVLQLRSRKIKCCILN